MSATDIRVGDLVKATRKDDPEDTRQFRLARTDRDYLVSKHGGYFSEHLHDFEVLDRPLPPISEELLVGAINTYRAKRGFPLLDRTYVEVRDELRAAFIETINYLRANDTYNKENSK